MSKKNSGEKPRSDEPAEAGEKFTVQVKLRPTFQERLAEVADDLHIPQGQLIEDQMKKYINHEYARVMEKKQREAGEKLKALREERDR